jgi:hypothetical protein
LNEFFPSYHAPLCVYFNLKLISHFDALPNEAILNSPPITLTFSFSHLTLSPFIFSQNSKDGGTYETVSQMIFTATRFENNALIRCEADNIVMRNELDKPMHDSLLLEVFCK